jgi:ubiquitin-protein ligase
MSNLAVKRIASDMKGYFKSNLNDCGIYCNFGEDNIYNVKVMIIGPENTPYENGFHLFDVNYPKDYPINPPHVTFVSTDKRVRAHPNLYINGKVCLSFLGTWSGPSWTPALTLNTILLSIQSLLNENPIQCEPGYENDTGTRAQIYKKVVNYYNIVVSTLMVMRKLNNGFDYFSEIVHKHFLKNFDSYLKQLESHKGAKEYVSSIYGRGAIINYKETLSALKRQYDESLNYIKELENKEPDMNEASEALNTNSLVQAQNITQLETSNEVIESESGPAPPIIPKKNTRKAPNIKAKDHEVGYEYLSENDGKMYIVIETKSGYKRWVKK